METYYPYPVGKILSDPHFILETGFHSSFSFSVGLRWEQNVIDNLYSEFPLPMEDCVVPLSFQFPADPKSMFPRKDEDEEIKITYADFGMINLNTTKYQKVTVSLEFEHITFNRLTKSQSKQVRFIVNIFSKEEKY